MRIVDAKAKMPEGAENESDKCELLLTGRLQTEITHGENCLDVESAEKLKECRGNQRELSMKQVWMTLHSLKSRIVSEVSTYTRPSSGPIYFCKVDSKALLNMSAFSGEDVGKRTRFLAIRWD